MALPDSIRRLRHRITLWWTGGLHNPEFSASISTNDGVLRLQGRRPFSFAARVWPDLRLSSNRSGADHAAVVAVCASGRRGLLCPCTTPVGWCFRPVARVIPVRVFRSTTPPKRGDLLARVWPLGVWWLMSRAAWRVACARKSRCPAHRCRLAPALGAGSTRTTGLSRPWG